MVKPTASGRVGGLAVSATLVFASGFLLLATPTAAAATTRVLTITTSSANPLVPFKDFDGNPPKVYDINGDGRLEIIAQNDNQYVYVFDSVNGRLLFEFKTKFPPGWGARSFNGPEVSLMSAGGAVRLIVANSAAYVTSLRFDPANSTGVHISFVKEWERRLSDCFTNPGMDAKPVLADLNKDGRLEILAATEENGIYALRDDGTLFWKQCIGGGNAEPGIGDLNLDGYPDVVHGSDGGRVNALNGRTGAFLWSYNAKAAFPISSGSMPVGPAIGQLDGLLGPDVVVGARDSHDAVNWSNDHALLLALKSNGQLLWGRQDPIGNPLTYTRPVIVDAAGDGTPEIYWGDWNTIGHKPPINESEAWKVTGPAHFYRYDPAGNMVWRQTIATYWSNKDVALGDVDGDGAQEVLVNGPGVGGDGIWYLNADTGAKETFVSVAPWKVSREPILADLWNTGTMQWVVEVNSGSSVGAILVYDTHVAYNAVYPHVPYPQVGPPGPPPPPPPPPPPSDSPFNATFTIKSPGVWWQEVTVAPENALAITNVQVRLQGGAWRAMTLRSWGAWASSYNAPAGTPVEFLATNSGGGGSQSLPFTWLDGVLVKASLPPGPPAPLPPFGATFVPKSITNNWWVEVQVVANHPVTLVEAQVNGGAWIGLPLQSWGNWAKSFFVPDGAQVKFRATDNAGATLESGPFTWG